MNLWLDDIRPAPAGYVWVKTAAEAIEVLKTGKVVHASLDHDVLWPEDYPPDSPAWEDEVTGYAVVKWMAANQVWPASVNVHSMNLIGAKRMKDLLAEHYGPVNHYRAAPIGS